MLVACAMVRQSSPSPGIHRESFHALAEADVFAQSNHAECSSSVQVEGRGRRGQREHCCKRLLKHGALPFGRRGSATPHRLHAADSSWCGGMSSRVLLARPTDLKSEDSINWSGVLTLPFSASCQNQPGRMDTSHSGGIHSLPSCACRSCFHWFVHHRQRCARDLAELLGRERLQHVSPASHISHCQHSRCRCKQFAESLHSVKSSKTQLPGLPASDDGFAYRMVAASPRDRRRRRSP